MKSYAQLLSEKLKKAGRDCVQSRKSDRVEVLRNTIEELSKDGMMTGTFWTWIEAVMILRLSISEQLLLCALWGYLSETRKEIKKDDFWILFQEINHQISDATGTLPNWIYEAGEFAVLSPVLYGWLEGEMPVLPEGVSLYFPNREVRYGLGAVLEDADKIMTAAEEQQMPGILCIEGEMGSGRTFCMEQICADREMSLLMIDGDIFKGSARETGACTLCAALYGAFVCVKLGKEIRERLLEDLSDSFRFYGIIKEHKRDLEEQPEVVVYRRCLERPDKGLKLEIAKEVLGEWIEELPTGVHLTHITGRQLPMGSYLRYLGNILAELEAGTIRMEHVQVPTTSSSLNLLPASRTFAELKLPKMQYDQLCKISKMIAARESVMSSWGFGSKFTYGNGMSVLFYGAPGTGKTMAAQVLANELGMPLYRVDLSQLISKYIGETQKNIGRIFDEAEKCDCILLFDEADAIFTKRSDVSDAQDRYSNAETAYLLQRIEAYAGVSILATNLLQNFDEAFRRRISYMVHFPMPDVNLRKELWESIFPKETPIGWDVDALTLAQAFELSGASIKNAALHGALYAKAEGCEVGMRHILDGIRNEYGKQGKSFSSTQRELLDAYQ